MKHHIYAMACGIFLFCATTACKNRTPEKESNNKTETTASSDISEKDATTKKQEETAYPEGKKLYMQYCATCHQANGSGVPNLNPPIGETEYVTGDKTGLINIILNGSDSGLEVNGQTYANVMPPHNFLDDGQVAQLLSYIRNSFGNAAGAVTASEVKTVRENSTE